jgi:hypothetical protein
MTPLLIAIKYYKNEEFIKVVLLQNLRRAVAHRAEAAFEKSLFCGA